MFAVSWRSRIPKPSGFRIRKGLDLPIGGRPDQIIFPGRPPETVAVTAADCIGLYARPLVKSGERVRLGQPLLSDRRHSEILFTSPGCGVVDSIEMGPRRSIHSVVIRLEGDEAVSFPTVGDEEIAALSPVSVRRQLLQSGLWTCLRTRPFGRIPAPDSQPRAIFIRAIDTNPLAADPAVIIASRQSDFRKGLRVLSRLAPVPLYCCQAGARNWPDWNVERLERVCFSGPHPAGLVGTHIHHLHPVGAGSTVWYIGYQEVIGIGELFDRGRLPTRKVIALAGPAVARPRLLESRIGCNLDDLLRGQLLEGSVRIISGPVLSGRTAFGTERFLGPYHDQVSVIPEARTEPSPSRSAPGSGYSWYRFLLQGRGGSRFSTELHGPPVGMLPLGAFDRVVPMKILVNPLLRALAVGDIEQAAALGCLELEEEDLALCSFLCPGKLEYGLLLRSALKRLEREA